MYLIIKTSEERIISQGSLFEAVRGHWRLDPAHASECTHAIAVVIGTKKVADVYSIDMLYPSTVCEGRYVFSGSRDDSLCEKLVGKTINPKLTARGLENPILYVNEDELLEV